MIIKHCFQYIYTRVGPASRTHPADLIDECGSKVIDDYFLRLVQNYPELRDYLEMEENYGHCQVFNGIPWSSIHLYLCFSSTGSLIRCCV